MNYPFPVLAQDGTVALRHAADRMNYASALAIHTGICFAAILYFVVLLHRIATTGRITLYIMMTLTAGTVIASLTQLSTVGWANVIYQVTYFNIDTMLRASVLTGDLTGGEPPGALSRLAVAVLFPSVLGIVSVVMGAGVACAALRRIGPPGADEWAAAFSVNMRVLFRCFYTLSAVLVTSTATALLFFRLPIGLFPAEGQFAKFGLAVSGYAGSVATFWGAIYTLTLLAVFAAPVTILYVRIRHHLTTQPDAPDFRDWLHKHGVNTSIGATLKNMFVVLAPLLVGPLGEITHAIG